MGSSRLPGKTLISFNGETLLDFIVNKLVMSGLSRSDIIVTTSTLDEDDPLEAFAETRGVGFFRGSPDLVSSRLIDCCDHWNIERFLLVLGDNPWISVDTAKSLISVSKNALDVEDYIVSPTPELVYDINGLRYHPIGTRLQLISTACLRRQMHRHDNEETREHVSKLFQDVDSGEFSARILTISGGWFRPELNGVNISINTRSDYDHAVTVAAMLLEQDIQPHEATVEDIMRNYKTLRK